MSTRTDFAKFIQEHGAEFQNVQTARLGNLSHVVETGTPGLLWARQWNGKEIKVINRANVPSDFDLRVLVGSTKIQPGMWFILLNMEDYLTPAAGGRIGYHHAQHEFGGPDEVAINRKQITFFTVRVEDATVFTVKVFGGVFPTENGPVQIYTQIMDMSSQVVDAGAVFVNIESDATGTLSMNAGTVFGSRVLATVSDVPATDPGKYLLAYILFFEGQTELLNDHIVVPMPLGSVASTITALDDIPDVNAPSPSHGDVLTYDLYVEEWVNAAPITIMALDDIPDVNAPSPSHGDVLTYDLYAEEWVNAEPTGLTINTQTGTSYTTQDSDNKNVITLDNGSGITLTVHQGAAAGFNCIIIQLGAGQVTVAAGGTGNIRNFDSHTKLAGQYATGSVVVVSNAGTAPEVYLSGKTGA